MGNQVERRHIPQGPRWPERQQGFRPPSGPVRQIGRKLVQLGIGGLATRTFGPLAGLAADPISGRIFDRFFPQEPGKIFTQPSPSPRSQVPGGGLSQPPMIPPSQAPGPIPPSQSPGPTPPGQAPGSIPPGQAPGPFPQPPGGTGGYINPQGWVVNPYGLIGWSLRPTSGTWGLYRADGTLYTVSPTPGAAPGGIGSSGTPAAGAGGGPSGAAPGGGSPGL